MIATLFHEAVNTFIVVNEGASPLQRGWGNAAAYGIVALSIVMFGWLKPPTSRNTGRRAHLANHGSE